MFRNIFIQGFIVLLFIFSLNACGSESERLDVPGDDATQTDGENDDGTNSDQSENADENNDDSGNETDPSEDIDLGDVPVNDTPEDNTDLADCGLSNAEQDMVQLINEARAQARTCGTQSFTATDPLKINCQLVDAALKHSEDMADNNFFSHTGSDGSSPAFRVTQAGYPSSFVGENVAAGISSALGTLELWFGSSGHCSNIMNSQFTEMGVAVASNPSSTYGFYWTLVLATP